VYRWRSAALGAPVGSAGGSAHRFARLAGRPAVVLPPAVGWPRFTSDIRPPWLLGRRSPQSASSCPSHRAVIMASLFVAARSMCARRDRAFWRAARAREARARRRIRMAARCECGERRPQQPTAANVRSKARPATAAARRSAGRTSRVEQTDAAEPPASQQERQASRAPAIARVRRPWSAGSAGRASRRWVGRASARTSPRRRAAEQPEQGQAQNTTRSPAGTTEMPSDRCNVASTLACAGYVLPQRGPLRPSSCHSFPLEGPLRPLTSRVPELCPEGPLSAVRRLPCEGSSLYFFFDIRKEPRSGGEARSGAVRRGDLRPLTGRVLCTGVALVDADT